MKTLLKFFLFIMVLVVAAVIATALLTPWMDRWGATDEEIAAVLPGDELVSQPKSIVNRVIAINAAPEQIYPWLVQMGAGKGGMYSYEWLETNMLRCPLVNADRIHPEWQDLQVGGEVKMCPEQPGPVPYTVAQIEANSAVVLGHQNPDGSWSDTWQFIIRPQPDGTSRLVARSRTTITGPLWTLLHPGIFIMERGMLLGIKERAEGLPESISQAPELPTPTPEIFIPLDPAPTPSGSDLPLTCQITDLNVFIERAADYCFAYPTHFNLGDQPSDHPVVQGPVLDGSEESINATFTIDVTPFDTSKSLQEQAEKWLTEFTVFDLVSMEKEQVLVGGAAGLRYGPVPEMLSWRIVFVQHGESLYRLMYLPVDMTGTSIDMDELYQTTLNTFAFID